MPSIEPFRAQGFDRHLSRRVLVSRERERGGRWRATGRIIHSASSGESRRDVSDPELLAEPRIATFTVAAATSVVVVCQSLPAPTAAVAVAAGPFKREPSTRVRGKSARPIACRATSFDGLK
jgi:hypothetical protein